MPSQNRHRLTAALQDHLLRDASTLVARQLSDVLTAADVFPDETDLAIVDATAGAINITLPSGSEDIIGLPWYARKYDASANAAGLVCAGADTFADSTTTLTTTTQGAEVGAEWDGTYWRQLGGAAPAAALAAANTITVGGAGAGTAAGAVNINKTAAGTADLNLKAANVLRGRVRLDASENLIISLHDGSEAVVGSITIAVATGAITLSKGTTITTGGLVISAGDLTLTLGNIAATLGSIAAGASITAATGVVATTGGVRAIAGGMRIDAGGLQVIAGPVALPLVNYANNAAAVTAGLSTGQLYQTAGIVMVVT